MQKITTIAELINKLNSAKCGGQYVTLTCTTDVRLNKFPTDGTQRIHIEDTFVPRKTYKVKYHFGADYERAMAKALGVESYNSHDSNRTHLVKNVLMQFLSTGNICFIYMPECYCGESTITLDGKELTDEQKAYMGHYLSKASASTLPYRNVGVKNVSRISFGGDEYELAITDFAAYKQAV